MRITLAHFVKGRDSVESSLLAVRERTRSVLKASVANSSQVITRIDSQHLDSIFPSLTSFN